MSDCYTQVWSRVTGFFRPVNDWNKGKSKEWEDRQRYKGVHNGDITNNLEARQK